MDSIPQSYQNLVIEAQLFPPIQTVACLLKSRKIYIEAHEHYQKRSFRNRYQIGSTQGVVSLSVPLLKGKNQQQSIRSVKISYTHNWPLLHWRAIQSSYGKSAFFNYYRDEIQQLLFTRFEYLFELNLKSLELILEFLQEKVELEYTMDYLPKDKPGFLDLRNQILPGNVHKFNIPEYYQVYSTSTGFLPQLSILDLIVHLGPEAGMYLREL